MKSMKSGFGFSVTGLSVIIFLARDRLGAKQVGGALEHPLDVGKGDLGAREGSARSWVVAGEARQPWHLFHGLLHSW
jgi:hypothetical protein